VFLQDEELYFHQRGLAAVPSLYVYIYCLGLFPQSLISVVASIALAQAPEYWTHTETGIEFWYVVFSHGRTLAY
jgi:hypothetical protein